MDNQLLAPKKTKRLNPKQRAFIENYLNPQSETYANLYKSGVKAGFSPTYSMNLKHLNPSWLSNTIEMADFRPEHVKQAVQDVYLNPNTYKQSKSPADTRLKALELYSRITGMLDTKQTTNITLVQPILSGASVQKKAQPKTDIIDI